MTEAPERIWVCVDDNENGCCPVETDPTSQDCGKFFYPDESTEYIRADLVPQWQPIETAPAYDPHKKTRVIVWNRFSQAVDYVLADGDFWRSRGDEFSLSQWMPLPSPPGDV